MWIAGFLEGGNGRRPLAKLKLIARRADRVYKLKGERGPRPSPPAPRNAFLTETRKWLLHPFCASTEGRSCRHVNIKKRLLEEDVVVGARASRAHRRSRVVPQPEIDSVSAWAHSFAPGVVVSVIVLVTCATAAIAGAYTS